ncbi:hypothetical protein VP01_6745g1, partial [Puccinia sorghi]
MSKSTESDPIDKLHSILYKTAIESIPLLTQENFSILSNANQILITLKHLILNIFKHDRLEQSVSSFHSSISYPSMHFVLDSGSSAHMTSNINLFFAISLKEERVVRKSSGAESLRIKGNGSIKLSNERGDFIFNNVLYVPKLCVNLLLVRCLLLKGYEVFFEINLFYIKQNNS